MKINSEVKVISVVLILCAVLLGLFVWLAPKTGVAPERDLSILVREGSHMTGKKEAKVTLVEFSDYQCPACATVAPFVKSVIDSYKGNQDFNFVLRHFPLSQHANAIVSAEAAESAAAQGKFFEMSELLFAKQAEWEGIKNPTDLFVGYADSLGLDTTKFRSDLQGNKYLPIVQADLRDANLLALDHTPFIFLNGVEVKDISSLKSQIDVALAK